MPFDHSYAQLWTRLFGRVPMKMLMLGLTGSGKTSLMYKYKMGDVTTTIPTIGMNIESCTYKNITFTVADVGTSDRVSSQGRWSLTWSS